MVTPREAKSAGQQLDIAYFTSCELWLN